MNNIALQSIKIRNDIPLIEARKIVRRISGSRKHHIFRETPNFYFFRILPKTHFKKNSLFTKKYDKDVSLIYGKLDLYYGGGFFDFIKNPIGTIKEAFRSIPSKLNNISTQTLEKFGNNIIKSMEIARTPLNNILEGALNTLSLGKFNELKKKYGYDKMFHLSLIVDVGEKVIIEKNEVVNIEPLSQSKTLNKNSEFLQVPINKNITLNELIEKTRQYMGNTKFYDYSAFENNCQNFIISVLESNAILTNKEKDFILQDAKAIGDDMKKSGFGFVNKITNGITKLGSFTSRLLGRGKKQKHDKNIKKFRDIVIKLIKERKFKFL